MVVDWWRFSKSLKNELYPPEPLLPQRRWGGSGKRENQCLLWGQIRDVFLGLRTNEMRKNGKRKTKTRSFLAQCGLGDQLMSVSLAADSDPWPGTVRVHVERDRSHEGSVDPVVPVTSRSPHRVCGTELVSTGGSGGLLSPQNCLSKQQLLSAIRQLQQLLKGQETRFAEGIRHMKSRLAVLQNSVSRVAPDAPPVSCPALSAPADGRKFGSKYLVDHEVHFTCNPGFRLVGPSSVVCLPNGNWTGEQPHCRDISECSSQPCQNGGTCVEGINQYRCICPPGRIGNRCQHQAQTAAPDSSVAGDPAFSRAPRCAQVERAQHCSCEAGFHLSAAAAGDSVCQDVNECELYGHEGRPRLCMHACVNIPGSYRCTCPSGYRTLADGKSCEDVDECVGPQHVCPRGTTCINTGGGFQCVSPECPEGSGNVSYVKTSPFQCERNPCPMDSRPCRHLPKTISFHYLSLPSNLKTPITLFRMATASAPGRPGPNSLRFGIAGGNSRGHFVMQRSDRQTGELILVQTLEGPQTLEVDVDMSEYLDRSFQANHVSKCQSTSPEDQKSCNLNSCKPQYLLDTGVGRTALELQKCPIPAILSLLDLTAH
ncbi:fibulin-7 [Carlito syrichta]|uniref:Fibulin-7 n=1 Tax=Carlito syrichta TaxID=1868482 RepID=A0A3Q0E0K3_CARSF|nr:fibulin-7 [Carlito syrichta]